MKPCELFPGAVVLDQDSNPIVIEPHNLYVMMDCVTPLPISPAVLRGLGAIKDEETGELMLGELFIDQDMSEFNLKYAHQYQSILLHIFGMELVWDQSEYETAIKEELS